MIEITAQMVASEATPARIPSKNGPVRGTSGKSMPNVVSAKRAPKVPVKKAQVHPSESDGDDYDDESDGILSELEDSNDEMVQLKPIAEGEWSNGVSGKELTNSQISEYRCRAAANRSPTFSGGESAEDSVRPRL